MSQNQMPISAYDAPITEYQGSKATPENTMVHPRCGYNISMQDPKPILLTDLVHLVPRDLMLFCLCPTCANEVNWRHNDASTVLFGSCCDIVFHAMLHDRKWQMYRVELKKMDRTNLYFFPRRSIFDQPPPKRHA